MAAALMLHSEVHDARRPVSIEDIEIQLLLDGVVRSTGIDVRDIAPAVAKRRIEAAMRDEGVRTVSALQERVLHDEAALERFIARIAVAEAAFFKGAAFYKTLRAVIVPMLRTYPFVRIWHVGCGSGEETYSLAMVMQEEGLLDRCKIYATEVSELVLARAREGSYSSRDITSVESAYGAAGGRARLADHASTDGTVIRVDARLRANVVFARYDPASDGSFNEFHLIVCRNVLSQYTPVLQSRVHHTLLGSLTRLGYLALGDGESLAHSPHEGCFAVVDRAASIYRRVR